MAIGKHRVDLQTLREELQSEESSAEFQRFLEQETVLRQFSSWWDLVGFIRSKALSRCQKDDLLCVLINLYRTQPCRVLTTVLAASFLCALNTICYRRRAWDDDYNELWQNSLLALLEVVGDLDLSDRSRPIQTSIIFETVRRLRNGCRREWRRQRRFEQTTFEELDEYASSESVGSSTCCAEELERMNQWRHRDHISQADYDLFIRVRVRGLTLRKYAATAGITYPAARQRYCRLVARYAALERKSKILRKTLSPFARFEGPLM